MEFDIAEIAKNLGGVIAFALVLYVGVIFYRRESNFSEEYIGIIDQYKERNQQLIDEIAALKVEWKAEVRELRAQIESLEGEVKALRLELTS